MMTGGWDPEQYARFHDERVQPLYDLLALVESAPGMRVVDLGCGTGKGTEVLQLRLKAADTLGVDGAETMLRRAPSGIAGLRFQPGDIGAFRARGEYDLVFSNAALHWIPRHEAILAQWAEALTERGQLAVQVPANNDYPTHLVADEVAGESPFREALGGWRREWPVLAPEAYATLLDRLGFRRQHVRLQVYAHHLESREAVVEWVKGTLLTQFQGRLGPELYPVFLARYRDRLFTRLEDRKPFFYPFKRILMWAAR